MGERASPLQLSENCILVRKQVADEAVAVALVHCQTRFLSGSQNAWRKGIGQCCNISLVGRSELDETSEMGTDRVKRCDVSETELAKSRLENRDPSFFRDVRSRGTVDGLDDLIDVRRNQ
jgi:hypothetical protein